MSSPRSDIDPLPPRISATSPFNTIIHLPSVNPCRETRMRQEKRDDAPLNRRSFPPSLLSIDGWKRGEERLLELDRTRLRMHRDTPVSPVVIDHAEGSSRHPTAGNCRIPQRSGKLRRIPFPPRILVLASEKRGSFEKSTSPPPHLSSRIRERGSVRGQRGANLNEGGGVWCWSQSRDGFGCVASFVIVA